MRPYGITFGTCQAALLVVVMGIVISMSGAAPASVMVIHSFDEANGNNYREGNLTRMGDRLAGTVGTFGQEAVFTIDLNGNDYQQVYADSRARRYADLEEVGGVLYGSAMVDSRPAIFSLNPDGSGFQVVHQIPLLYRDVPDSVDEPIGAFSVVGTKLYGSTYNGRIYSFDTASREYQVLFNPDEAFANLTDFPSVLPYYVLRGPSVVDDRVFWTSLDSYSIHSIEPFNVTEMDGILSSVLLDGSDYQIHGTLGQQGWSVSGIPPAPQPIGLIGHNGKEFYRLNLDGLELEVLDSAFPLFASFVSAPLVSFGDRLYGSYLTEISSGNSVIYSVDLHGMDFRIDYELSEAEGRLVDTLIPVGNRLYGSSRYGGEFDNGTIFYFTVPEPGTSVLLIATLLWGVAKRRIPHVFKNSLNSK